MPRVVRFLPCTAATALSVLLAPAARPRAVLSGLPSATIPRLRRSGRARCARCALAAPVTMPALPQCCTCGMKGEHRAARNAAQNPPLFAYPTNPTRPRATTLLEAVRKCACVHLPVVSCMRCSTSFSPVVWSTFRGWCVGRTSKMQRCVLSFVVIDHIYSRGILDLGGAARRSRRRNRWFRY